MSSSIPGKREADGDEFEININPGNYGKPTLQSSKIYV
jgi:hypothetical protein